MRAQVLTAFGGPENFGLTEVETPRAGAGQVLIRIAATSVNPIDTKIRAGLPVGPALPAILGADVAGVVEAIGPGVDGFAVGEAVYGCVGGVRGHAGALAEYIVADARLLAPKPRSLTMHQAAALPLVSLTAWDALERTGLAHGQHILVHGGVGGVGHVAIQIARAIGALIATTVADDQTAKIARELGARNAINFHVEDIDTYVARLTGGQGFDVVFDTIGGDNLPKSFAATATSGQVATTNARTTQDLSVLHAKGLSLHVVFTLLPMLTGRGLDRHGQIMGEITDLVEAGSLRPLIDPTAFTLETAPDAHRFLESGKAIGKVVIDIDPSI